MIINDSKLDKNYRLGVFGILLGLAGVIISLVTPAIEISTDLMEEVAADLKIFLMFFYLFLAGILVVFAIIICKRTFNLTNYHAFFL